MHRRSGSFAAQETDGKDSFCHVMLLDCDQHSIVGGMHFQKLHLNRIAGCAACRLEAR